ncbi:MAG: T9SS type A sorting domain-containing protein [bacterium]|nr:T9SS type A sorting domain-containing protein [bacterium]
MQIRATSTTCSNVGITTFPGGGAALVWREAISSPTQMVYVQAISDAGDIQWPADGVRVLSSTRYHTQPKITNCGNGSLMVASGADLGYVISMEVTRLNLVTGESLWPNYLVHGTSNGYVDDFELAPALDGGAYLAMVQDTNGPGGNDAELTLARVAPHAEWRGSYTEIGEFDDVIIGEIKPGILAMAWSDADNEVISCKGITFEDQNNVEELWIVEEFGQAAIQLPIGGQVNLSHGLTVAWTDGGDLAATFIDFNGIHEHNFPHVATLTDIPEDQGGWLAMNWEGSTFDQSEESIITQYSLWLRPTDFDMAKAFVPADGDVAKAASGSGADLAQVEKLMSEGWSYLSTVPALGQASYNALVPTTADQFEGGDPYTEYMVIAHEMNNANYYRSEPGVGLSMDNVAPGAPAGLAGEYDGDSVNLQWNAVADFADDLAGYVVYGSSTQGFVPSSANLLGEVVSTDYVDASVTGTMYYVVTAKDAHGNESDSSSEVEVESTTSSAGLLPDVFQMSGVYPNPFNPNTAFEFQIPAASFVEVDVMDLRGNRVRKLMSEDLSGGSYELRWDGRDESGRMVNSGVYFARVRTSFGMQTAKMTLAK